jgi:hypothetical protein
VELSKLFDLARWFNPFPEPPGILYIVALVAFGLWTIASIAVYLYRRRLFVGNGALIGIVTRFGPYAITIGGIGMFLLVVRFVGIPYISIRFLVYLTILAAIGYLVFLGYYLARRYPRRVAQVRAAEIRRRYTSTDRRKKKRRR